jgi:hypothetical protein
MRLLLSNGCAEPPFVTAQPDAPLLLRYDDGYRPGTELDGLETVRTEALAMLGGIARDELPDGDARECIVRIRDEAGSIPLTASLVLRVER